MPRDEQPFDQGDRCVEDQRHQGDPEQSHEQQTSVSGASLAQALGEAKGKM
jgi:hypothetical protein